MCETQLQDVLPEEPEVVDIVPEVSIPSEEPKAKKKGWVPYLILAVIFIVGLTVYLVTPRAEKVRRYRDPQLPWFSIENGTLYFDADKYTGGSTLQVPETVAGQAVTALSENCFSSVDSFIMVKLPNTLKVIGYRAFAGCPKLRGVLIPGSVVTIGSNAFLGCNSLESLCIPPSVTAVGKGAFGLCPRLNHIFYSGSANAWARLYREPIAPGTCIYAADGVLRQADIVS
jgi:hypothetical protein